MQILSRPRAACAATGNTSGLVFPSDTGATPISGWNKLKANLDRTVRANMVDLTDAERRAIQQESAWTRTRGS